MIWTTCILFQNGHIIIFRMQTEPLLSSESKIKVARWHFALYAEAIWSLQLAHWMFLQFITYMPHLFRLLIKAVSSQAPTGAPGHWMLRPMPLHTKDVVWPVIVKYIRSDWPESRVMFSNHIIEFRTSCHGTNQSLIRRLIVTNRADRSD